PSMRAALRPAAPPPTTTASHMSLSLCLVILPITVQGSRHGMPSCESGKVRIVNDELRALGPRLRGLRLSRGLTLERLSERSGISASTISRLESGKRQASLELLLPLTRELGATLDDLVPAADPDPRVRRSLIRHGGIVFAPLSRPSSAMSAYKITYPPGTPLSAPQTHEGRDWLYVL